MINVLELIRKNLESNISIQNFDTENSFQNKFLAQFYHNLEIQIVYVKNGSGILESENVYFHVPSGSVVILFSYQSFMFKAIQNTGWNAINFNCSNDLLVYMLCNELIKPFPIVIQCGIHEVINSCFSKVLLSLSLKNEKALKREVSCLLNKALELASPLGLLERASN